MVVFKALLLAAVLVGALSVSPADVAALRAQVEEMTTEVAALRAAIREEAAELLPAPRRALSQSSPKIHFTDPDASLAFANGTTMYEADADGSPALHSSTPLSVGKDLFVKGNLVTAGSDLNLGVPLVADSNITRGDVVSMVGSGRVAKGFGSQVSASLGAVGSTAGALVIVSHSETSVSVLRTDTAGMLWVTYFDAAQGVSAGVEVTTPGEVVEDFTAAALGPESLLVCFKTDADAFGHCRAATLTGLWTFGAVLDVTTSGQYFEGAATNLHGEASRAILTYTMVLDDGSERFNAQLITVAGSTASLSGVLPLNIVSSSATDLAAVSLTSLTVMVSYLSIQDGSAQVRMLYFEAADPLTLRKHAAADLSQARRFTHMSVGRLDDTHGVVGFRSPDDGNAVYAVTVDATTPAGLAVGSPAGIVSGTPTSDVNGLRLSLTAPSADRVGFAFLDSSLNAVFVDCGVFGDTVVAGRPQAMESGTATAVAAVATAPGVSYVVSQPAGDGLQALVRSTTMFGGPTMLGFAKGGAAPGDLVTVMLQGAMDGFAGLAPGAPYYARYDGGIDVTPDSANGVSSAVVGRAITPTVLMSAIGADGDAVKQDIGDLATDVSSLQTEVDAMSSCVTPVWEGLAPTHYVRKDLPIMRWAVWSTYVDGWNWMWGNDARFVGGVAPSNWGNNRYRADHISSSKRYWVTLFNKYLYCSPQWCNVWSNEYRYQSSTDSRHVGVLFRVNNTTPDPISWTVHMYYSAYNSWEEVASLSINGESTWNSGGSNCYTCYSDITFTVPSGRISTVIALSSSGHPSNTRPALLGFQDMDIPDGLEWVDDLHYNIDGGWES